MPLEYLEKSFFIFVTGLNNSPESIMVKHICEKYPYNTICISEIRSEDWELLYEKIDCLVCTSEDDSPAVVFSEAFKRNKIIIASENTGSAEWITDNKSGFIFKNSDSAGLLSKMQYVIDNIYKLDSLRREAGEVYHNVIAFSNCSEKYKYNVSVIIPTYNAGDVFNETLTCLLSQKNIEKIEVTIVDSGSTDNTVAICKSHGVNLIQIPNEKFTHSYARNLGAENSTGEFLLFMTQDAMPSSFEWVYDMIKPIAYDEAVAVSCSEVNPKNTDLYYRIESCTYAKYVGIAEHDVIGRIENCVDINSTRKNSSLNDVACAVKAKIFYKFKYKFDCVEDVDLGIRLLRAGYKIKLLSETKVIHGHNRSPGYYLKRTMVETVMLNKILGCENKITEDENNIGKRIVFLHCMVTEIVNRIEKLDEEFGDVKNFIAKAGIEVDNVLREFDKYNSPIYGTRYSDDVLDFVVSECEKAYHTLVDKSSANYALDIKIYLMDSVCVYLKKNNILVDSLTKKDICACLFRRLAVIIGADLVKMGDDCKIADKLHELKRGV
jgi:glycosyltransferase involved in cell wall biosynthesis